MTVQDPELLRNIIVVSHSGAGKTTLTEALLFAHGATTRQGTIAEGNTVTDYDPIEVDRAISINIAFAHFRRDGVKVNVLDTPGYADFILEVKNGLPAADAALVIVSAADGVEVGTMRVWDMLAEQEKPCAVVISKLDKENTDFSQTLSALQATLGRQCVACTVPMGTAAGFSGVTALLAQASPAAELARYREALIEQIAENNDELMEKYLAGQVLSPAELSAGMRQAFLQRQIVPVFCVNALTQIGIKELAQAIVDFFPSPVSRGLLPARAADTQAAAELPVTTAGPFSAFVVKTISDPYVGQLSVFRVVSGQLCSNTEFYNVAQGAVERIGQLYTLQGKEQLPVECIAAGDIGAVAKLKNTHTGDSLSNGKHKSVFPFKVEMQPAISYSLKPKSRQDEEKISQALARLLVEDLGLKTSRDAQTHELILSGMGDMHLEITIDRLRRRYHVEVEVGTPKVPYKETIRKSVKVQGKYKKQSGGRGQYGDVWLELTPLERGRQFEFLDKIVGGVVPRQYVPSVEKGVRRAMEEGALAGYPLVDVQVTIYDGSYHDVDSSDMAFQIAGSMALKKGVLEANPALLEPIMDVEIVVPDEFMGAVNGDLSSRRGRVQGMEAAGKYEKVAAKVPLAEMLRYATDLRSMTHGVGSYTMQFSHYEEVPGRIAETIIAQAKVEHVHEHEH